MVFKYQRKCAPVNQSLIQQALQAVDNGMSVNAAAKQFAIPESTLRRHRNAQLGNQVLRPPGGIPSLPPSQEVELATLVKTAAEHGFAFSMEDIRVFVGKYVTSRWHEESELGHYLRTHCRFTGPSRMPGRDWMERFMQVHHLSLKTPGRLEKVRKMAESNPFKIFHFYDILGDTISELQLADRPDCIWNLDESAFFLDARGGKVVGEIGVRTKRAASGTGRSCFTAMACVSAAGQSCSPVIIFEGKHLQTTWKGTSPSIPKDTIYEVSGRFCMMSVYYCTVL
jgi:hypothetical protein